jgi:hypothetical protein
VYLVYYAETQVILENALLQIYERSYKVISNQQNKFFFEARDSVLHEIDQNMYDWDFLKMIDELKRAIESCGIPSKNNRVRFFSRRYLGMSGQRFTQVQSWIRGESVMSFNDITHVLGVLSKIRNGSLHVALSEKKEVKKVQVVISDPKLAPGVVKKHEASGVVRKIIDHTIGSIQSLASLMAEADVKPADAFDSDRRQVQGGIQKLCTRLGVKVNFPESETAQAEPLTKGDLAEVGLEKTIRRKKR